MAVDWIVSGRTWTTQSPIINGGAQNVTAALGGLYLISPTAALDMLARVVVAMTAGAVADAAAFVTEARYVRLTSSGVFTIDWTGATTLRDLLGFEANLAAASSYTATARSPLLWSPGKVLTPDDLLGSHGRKVLDISATIGAGGNVTVRQEGDATVVNKFSAQHIPKARYFATPPTYALGDYVYFWENELCTGKKWHVLRGVTEGLSTTASASYGSATAIGPYKADLTVAEFRRTPGVRSAGFERVDAYFDVTPIPAVKTDQFA